MLSLHAAQHRANRKRTANGSSHPTASETGKYKAGASKTGTSKASAAKATAPTAKPRIGLAIAGGGPIGGMYELGALRALDEAIEGLDLTRLDCYVGVSSGAFLAAGLANRMDTAEMCRIFVTGDSADVEFRPETFMRPAFLEYIKRAASFPRLATEWWRELLFSPLEARWSDLITRFGGLIPNGLFDNAQVELFLREVFTRRGRSNDFRELDADLYVVAVDIDSGDAVRFGGDNWNDVPISQAVQASAALPGLYPPVQIRGRHFVDGALRRTMHASVVLERGIDLLIGINPLVPFNHAQGVPVAEDNSLAAGGLPAVLSQTSAPCCNRACRSGWRVTPSNTRTSTSWCSNPTPRTASCSSPTPSVSRRASASARSPTATPWPTCACARTRWGRCWPRTACACARTCWPIPSARSSTGSSRRSAIPRPRRGCGGRWTMWICWWPAMPAPRARRVGLRAGMSSQE
ncbi:patatin-like phospholipase family protein [Lysobacter capsici]|uniref:patatin-like phospholipase family protein n=1 Tax=Lysobacter capsici TaxID=435897 RepID=UPI00398CABC9